MEASKGAESNLPLSPQKLTKITKRFTLFLRPGPSLTQGSPTPRYESIFVPFVSFG